MLLILSILCSAYGSTGLLHDASTRPVSRHIGHWSSPPQHCPTSMVSDGPLLGNGDMGAALGGAVNGALTFFTGKMDFWTQTSGPKGRTDSRHLTTHVAPGNVTLQWGVEAAPLHFEAWQDLEHATVNASVGYGTANLTLSAVLLAEENVLVARMRVDKAVLMTISLGSGNLWDLPIRAGVQGTTLTLAREANAWLNNAAVLVECDSEMVRGRLSRGSRGALWGCRPYHGMIGLMIPLSGPACLPLHGTLNMNSLADDNRPAWRCCEHNNRACSLCQRYCRATPLPHCGTASHLREPDAVGNRLRARPKSK